ncbi:hypothetical protein NKJ06_29600 [Mesorhizobium sp. M0293]|uniref:hypothetical protein n=1 Tax=unclassified Mesorhizobium TaxID=325217 RepID=UPI00333DB907
MSFFIEKMSRRTLVQALVALPALSMFRKLPDADGARPGQSQADPSGADPNEIVEINGWILKRSDLA